MMDQDESRQGLYRPEFEHDSCGTGFITNINGHKTNQIIDNALTMLENMEHRGACGCDPLTGDGAGVLIQLPHEFLARETAKLGFMLPAPGEYGAGAVFMPLDPEKREACERIFARVISEESQRFLGWRTVPIDPTQCGEIARQAL